MNWARWQKIRSAKPEGTFPLSQAGTPLLAGVDSLPGWPVGPSSQGRGSSDDGALNVGTGLIAAC